eukprot:992777-Amphidinium_carterae.1
MRLQKLIVVSFKIPILQQIVVAHYCIGGTNMRCLSSKRRKVLSHNALVASSWLHRQYLGDFSVQYIRTPRLFTR